MELVRQLVAAIASSRGATKGARLELPQGERVVRDWEAVYSDQASDAAGDLTAEVMGSYAGAVVPLEGRPMRLVVTNRGRLLLQPTDAHDDAPIPFGPSNRPMVADTGVYGEDALESSAGRAERAKMLIFIAPHGQHFRVLVPESAAPAILRWSA